METTTNQRGTMKTITRKNRMTGTHITVSHANDAGLELERGHTVWYTICEEHNQCCGHATKALALHHATAPSWCEVCAGTDLDFSNKN
jgi:hypothetical protein